MGTNDHTEWDGFYFASLKHPPGQLNLIVLSERRTGSNSLIKSSESQPKLGNGLLGTF